MRPGLDDRSARWISWRIAAVAVLFALGFATVLGRAVQLQVVQQDRLASEARDQYLRQLVLKPRRGVVTDRAGVPLAVSADAESVFVDPEAFDRAPSAAVTKLARTLGVDARTLARKAGQKARFAWVKRRVSPAEAAAVRKLAVPGVGLVAESKRYYPKGPLAANLLGVVGDDGNGLEGLERALDEVLRGEPSRVPSLRDGAGKTVLRDAPDPGRSREGARVELTVDQGLQLATEQALSRAVTGSHALSGMAIALEPTTGEVLAIATWPTFNPNAPRPGEVLKNRAVTDTWEPGSTFKTFAIAGALDRGVLKPNDAIDCGSGELTIGAHTIHDHAAVGWAGPSKILAMSSNIGAARIGARLGRDGLHDVLTSFGFGERTGVGLPAEHRGQIPPFRSDISVATASFGHGVTATALQITTAMGAIANGGVLVRPRVVKRVVDVASGEVLEEGRPEPVRRVVRAETAATMGRWLAGVIESEKGTGRRARLDGWRAGGKTGTAQKADAVSGGYSTDRHFSSFVGFAPLESPRITIGVFIDEPKGEIYGGEVAAPAFRQIAEYALKMLGVPPTAPAVAAAAPEPDPAAEPGAEVEPDPPAVEFAARESSPGDTAVPVPSLAGLPARSAIRLLESRGLLADVDGSGRVTAQSPAAGRLVDRGSRVRLTLAPPG
ncbi:MAG TPA: penicillin-binding protein [Anaeromyxobacteraceae bacterium]|nr:penicillin-binding protein [Anaeromyxobacteraceae bacterium]